VGLLNGLSGRNIDYDVIYAHDVKPGVLLRYAAAVNLAGKMTGTSGAKEIEAFATSGKTVFSNLPETLDVASELAKFPPEPVRSFAAPAQILYRVVSQPQSHRLIIHLLNYAPVAAGPVRISLRQQHRRIRLLSPDVARSAISLSPSGTELEVPSVTIYSMLILEK
jgi:hypothetical protein